MVGAKVELHKCKGKDGCGVEKPLSEFYKWTDECGRVRIYNICSDCKRANRKRGYRSKPSATPSLQIVNDAPPTIGEGVDSEAPSRFSGDELNQIIRVFRKLREWSNAEAGSTDSYRTNEAPSGNIEPHLSPRGTIEPGASG